MADVKYRQVDANAGAVPVDTNFRTTQSTEAGHTTAQIQHVKLDTGDGTNTQPVSGTVTANPGDITSVTGTASSSDGVADIINQDVTGYKSVSVQLTGTWAGTFTFAVTNDDTNWISLPVRDISSVTSGYAVTKTANGIYCANLPTCKTFRVRWTTATSGSPTATAYFSKVPAVQDFSHVILTGTGSANYGKAIDSAVGGTDTGIAALVKRVTTPGTITPAAGDYTPLQVDDSGRLWVAPLVTGTNIIGGVQLVDEAGALYGVKHISNKPRVSSMPYLYDIAEGNVSGHTAFTKLGYNGDVGATEEDIITQGGVYPWIGAAGIALDVASSSSDDELTGPGVQKVKITYLDTDYSLQSQTISLTGTTPVALTDTTILRVNSIRATQVGANGVASGDITVENVGGSTIYRQISAGFTRGRGLTYTVPLGKTLYLTSIAVSSGFTTAGKVVRWFGRAQVDDTDPTTKINFFQPFFEIITQDASFTRQFEVPIKIPATADLKVSAISNNAGSFCNCALRGWLE